MSTPSEKHLAATDELFARDGNFNDDDSVARMEVATILARHFPEPALSAGDAELAEKLLRVRSYFSAYYPVLTNANLELRAVGLEVTQEAADRLTQLAARVKELEGDGTMLDWLLSRDGNLLWLGEGRTITATRDAIRSAMKQEGTK